MKKWYFINYVCQYKFLVTNCLTNWYIATDALNNKFWNGRDKSLVNTLLISLYTFQGVPQCTILCNLWFEIPFGTWYWQFRFQFSSGICNFQADIFQLLAVISHFKFDFFHIQVYFPRSNLKLLNFILAWLISK